MPILVAAYYALVAAALAWWLKRRSLWFTSLLSVVISQVLLLGVDYLYRGHWESWSAVVLFTSTTLCVAVVTIVALIAHRIRSRSPRTTAVSDSLASIIGLARVACLPFALVDVVGLLWFFGDQSTWIERVMFPAPWCALIFGALAPRALFRDPLTIAAAVALYLLAEAELIRQLIAVHTWITLLEAALLTLVFAGRLVQEWINSSVSDTDL